ncbi:hypothetical protein E0H93_28590 [Rhizobium leguminosarum bv. viciae]|uniref:hypothetical protein n=1 Tax=Rhizobium leguminosarum TaxID=384 RepID=UPI00103AB2E6|nr:hypothetical protein [Rhizobium leguminosarum]TBY27403.1 hypothetical protein E0H55_27315 [Rhizobium leguminosarum bv. viciae]TCA99429.1 hypothetical protein E0H93_28590 [Rhizobium leguminosarum bv. viciae]
MAGAVYYYGSPENWQRSLDEQAVVITHDAHFFEAWRNGDYDAYLALERKFAKPETTDTGSKINATTWFNLSNELASSEDDIWVTRRDGYVWWGVTTSAPVQYEPHVHPDRKVDVVAICKPVFKWTNKAKNGKSLLWKNIHPKGHNILFARRTITPVKGDRSAYIRALLAGDDLSPWHDQKEWKAKLGNRTLLNDVGPDELALLKMMESIQKTVANSNGQIVQKTIKDKLLKNCTPEEMKAHLCDLLTAQDGFCKITGIKMHQYGQENQDDDFLPSPDRIDSSGHYEIGNMQIVCRFINFWKLAQDNGRFHELLEHVIKVKSAVSGPKS